MKKKLTKKLALSKETLRNLEVRDIQQAAGGAYSFYCQPGDGTYYCASVRLICKEPPY